MSYNSRYKGSEVDAALDLARMALQNHQDITGKQDKNLYFTNIEASSWTSSSTYDDYPYQCDIDCNGVTSNHYAEIIFDIAESSSGSYAPICETLDNVVRIYSKVNSVITIPTIIIHK